MVVFENFKLEPSSEVEHVLFWQKCISVFANKESFLINEIVKHKKWRWGAAKFNNERVVQQQIIRNQVLIAYRQVYVAK